MATAETVLTVYSDAGMRQENRALESWMSSKVSCPVWGEGIGKVLPSCSSNSPVSYATARTDLCGGRSVMSVPTANRNGLIGCPTDGFLFPAEAR